MEKICLPSPEDPITLEGKTLSLLGFGQTYEDERNDDPGLLREVFMTVYSRTYCNNKHNVTGDNWQAKINEKKIRTTFPNDTYIFSENQFCAGSGRKKIGSCSGDSGGAALYSPDPSTPWVQYGLNYGNVGDNNCDSHQYPSTFMRLNDPGISNWIQETMKSMYILLS